MQKVFYGHVSRSDNHLSQKTVFLIFFDLCDSQYNELHKTHSFIKKKKLIEKSYL